MDLGCSECDKIFPGTATIKGHYLKRHKLTVKVSTISAPSPPRKMQPTPSPQSNEDADMEDIDNSSLFHPSSPVVPLIDAKVRGDSPDPQSDGNDDNDDDENDDEWDMESVVSDASTEVLLEEDEDDIVPRSFNPLSSADPSLHDDHLEFDEESPDDSPEAEEGLPSPASVYRSDSEFLRSCACDAS